MREREREQARLERASSTNISSHKESSTKYGLSGPKVLGNCPKVLAVYLHPYFPSANKGTAKTKQNVVVKEKLKVVLRL